MKIYAEESEEYSATADQPAPLRKCKLKAAVKLSFRPTLSHTCQIDLNPSSHASLTCRGVMRERWSKVEQKASDQMAGK